MRCTLFLLVAALTVGMPGMRAADAARPHGPADTRTRAGAPSQRAATEGIGGETTAATPGSIAALRTLPIEGGYKAMADNRLAGPVEVGLRFAHARNIQSEPALPTRRIVPAGATALVATLGVLDPALGGDFELQMDVVPGDPRARPADVEYLLPLRSRELRIDQGFGGSFSHSDVQNRYAIDLAAPVGTPVLAAREGVVMEVQGDYVRAGRDRDRDSGRANMVRLLHADGAMSVYAHLKRGGVLVRTGQRVRAGEVIGLSGDTGFTTGPHLHFAVQANRGMRLESIPFRMRGPHGPLQLRGN